MSMTGDTMVEALRRANPVPDIRTDGFRSQPSAHALFADIVTRPAPGVWRHRRRVRALVIVIAIVAIGLALVAFVAVRKDAPTLPTSVVCYSSADLGARRIVVGSTGDAAKACESIWSSGGFAGLGTQRSASGFDVCVLPSGVAAVFPGESGSVCSRLGLAASSGGDERIPSFAAETDRRVSASCIGHDPAEQIIKDELAKHGLDDWTVKRSPRPFDAGHPCASIYVDAPAHQVGIVPIANPYPSSTVTTG